MKTLLILTLTLPLKKIVKKNVDKPMTANIIPTILKMIQSLGPVFCSPPLLNQLKIVQLVSREQLNVMKVMIVVSPTMIAVTASTQTSCLLNQALA